MGYFFGGDIVYDDNTYAGILDAGMNIPTKNGAADQVPKPDAAVDLIIGHDTEPANGKISTTLVAEAFRNQPSAVGEVLKRNRVGAEVQLRAHVTVSDRPTHVTHNLVF